jgi:hypothetical protein
MKRDEEDDGRPRWRDADEEPDEPRDWEEVESEEEPGSRGGVLGGTAPVAKFVFAAVLIVIVVATVLALKGGLQRWFGG